MAPISEARRAYLKQYREQNKARLNELNKKGYQRRKIEQKRLKSEGHIILNQLKDNKQQRLAMMTTRRLERRLKLQQAIYDELENGESVII